MDVQDKPTENGIKINNILTALILAAILWVASSIDSIKEDIGRITTGQEVNNVRIDLLEHRTEVLEIDSHKHQ